MLPFASGSRSDILSGLAQEDRDQGEYYVYQHPDTNGRSELAGKAAQHGVALAKRIGAKATVLTVLPPFHTFTTNTQMLEDTPAQYKARMQDHAEKTLGAVATQRKQQASRARWSMSSMSIPTKRSSIPRS